MKTRLLLLFALITLLPSNLMAYDYRLKVGETLRINVPGPLYGSDYTYLDYTDWTSMPPVSIVTSCADYVIVRADKEGSGSVSCNAYYRKKRGDWESRRRSGYWTIECYKDPYPNPDPNPDPNQKDYKYGDYVTSTTEEGVTMTFYIDDVLQSENKKWPCSVMSDDPYSGKAAISKSTSGKVTIPEVVPNTKGCSVLSSLGQRYMDLDGLIVKEISIGAFYQCANLTEVVVPSSVNYISISAFDGCTSLKKLTLLASTPPDVKNKEVFMQSAYNQVVVQVPKGAKSKYRNAKIWEDFRYIIEEGESVEYNDGDIFTADTKEGVKMYFQVISAANKTCRVGQYNNDNWWPSIDSDTEGKVTIPENVNGFTVVEIANEAFWDCSLVSTFTIPNTVKTIGDYAFIRCSNITSITLPNSLVAIGQRAFMGCQGLKSISIPKSVTSIASGAFGDSGITSLYITDLTAWLRMSIDSKYPYVGWQPWNKVRLYLNNNEVKDLVIPSSIKSINDFSFCNISSLTSVTIPNSVKSIGLLAFSGCEGLKEIRSEIKEPFDIDAFDSQTYSNALLYVPDGTKLKYKKRAGWTKFRNIVDNGPEEQSIVTKITSSIKQLAAGRVHSLALTEDGTLWGWGANTEGQIGIRGDALYEKPTKVTTNVASVATNNDYTLIVKKDGTLWACGDNSYGQLGNGKEESSNVPIKITENVVAAAAGYYHTLVLKSDGTVWTCGYNYHGQLGLNDKESRQTLTKVADNVKSIGAGAYSSYIVKNDGTLWGCGRNDHGQLADKTTEDRATFVRITDNVSYVASKLGAQLLVVKSDGTLWSAGYNHKGQLGNGSTADRNELKQIATNVISAQGNWYTSLVLKRDGTLWGCGNNQYGNLGDGTTKDALNLKEITNDVVSAALGLGHILALKSDGSLWVCGDNRNCQLGDGTLSNRLSPMKVIEAPQNSIMDIDDLKTNTTVQKESIYSLSGQRLDAPRKGINIINGKKVVIK